ncbi:MAG: hypothetical protein AB1420_16165 [Bacillota bacterium]
MKQFGKILRLVILVTVISAAIYVIAFDKGNYADKPAGAGQIWWADVPIIEEFYQDLKARRQ